MGTAFDREYNSTDLGMVPAGSPSAPSSLSIDHYIARDANLTTRIADGDTTVRDGFRVLVKVLNADAGARLQRATTSSDGNHTTLWNYGSEPVQFEANICYRHSLVR